MVICALGGLVPFMSYAIPGYEPQGKITTLTGFGPIIQRVSAAMFGILMVISIILVLYAAFLYITAAGDSEKITKAGQTITYAVVGIIVALLASGVPDIVNSLFG
jgi:hypothetical protein